VVLQVQEQKLRSLLQVYAFGCSGLPLVAAWKGGGVAVCFVYWGQVKLQGVK